MSLSESSRFIGSLSSLEYGGVGVAAINSIDFVRRSFALFSASQPAATFRSDADRTQLAKIGVREFITPADEKGWTRLEFNPQDGEELAQILFTSGTTGAPKAIALSKTNIANTIGRLNSIMKVDSGIREYIGVPVTYSFGLARARAVSAAGGEFYLPQHGFSPSEIADMLKRGDINAISAVPTLWRLLMQNSDLFGRERTSLRWIEIGSQLMTRPEKESLKALFPNAIIVQHYGLTEASRTTFLRIHETEGEALTSVGEAIDPVEIKTDFAGRIMIRGPHIAQFEITAEGPAALTDQDGWLTTNDVGYIANGFLHFEGRIDDLINCGGVKINPESLEQELAQTLNAAPDEIVVARLPDPLRGDSILVALSPNSAIDALSARTAAIKATAALGLNLAGAIHVSRVADLARTETGKIKRSAIAGQYIAKSDENALRPAGALEAKLVDLWRTALGVNAISPEDRFFDLGGDLLAAEALISEMEAAGVPPDAARGMLDGLSIREIAQRSNVVEDAASRSEFEHKILTIWREALGRDDVSVEDSFYDIGGDSLSAVTVALNLERAGLDPALAHGVFDGKSIRQLAQDYSNAPGEKAAADQRTIPEKTEIAVFSEASNFMKGVVLVCMIASHWLPPYLQKFGLSDGPLAGFLAIFFSLGTPTLAFMFGTGLVFFHARQFRHSRKAFDRNVLIALALLATGVAVHGVLELSQALAAKAPITSLHLQNRFYNPFLYFLIATASLPLWIGRVGKGMGSVIALGVSSLVLYAGYAVLDAIMPQGAGPKPLHENLLIGRWSLLQMGSLTLFGAAVGQFIQIRLEAGRKLNSVALFGVILIIGAVISSVALGEAAIWFEHPKAISLFTAFFYSGIALVVISLFRSLSEWTRPRQAARIVIDIVCCIGILLFPLFVLQSTVYLSASIWYNLAGGKFLVMLGALILAFSVVAGVLIRKVYNIYYAGRQ